MTADELLRSSERVQRMLRVTGGSASVGAMVLNGKGEIIGLVRGDGRFGSVVVPVEAFSRRHRRGAARTEYAAAVFGTRLAIVNILGSDYVLLIVEDQQKNRPNPEFSK